MEPQAASPVADYPPLALAEAFDFLDAAWRVAFGAKRKLLVHRTASRFAGLSLGCSTRSDFSARVSELADVFKHITIPDDMLNNGEGTEKDHTLVRLEKVMEAKLDEEAGQRARHAVGTLRNVNNVRRALEHSGVSIDSALGRLGIDSPVLDWSEAWKVARGRTIEALTTIRNELLDHANDSTD